MSISLENQIAFLTAKLEDMTADRNHWRTTAINLRNQYEPEFPKEEEKKEEKDFNTMTYQQLKEAARIMRGKNTKAINLNSKKAVLIAYLEGRKYNYTELYDTAYQMMSDNDSEHKEVIDKMEKTHRPHTSKEEWNQFVLTITSDFAD